MLQLVLGVAGSGKTTHMLNEIKQRASAGLPSILLVPEQFSSSAEMLSFRTLGDEKSDKLEIVSFRTLSERIFKTCGWPSGAMLSEAGRIVFTRRALDALGDSLHSFSRHRRSAAFCRMCADTIGELKTAGARPEQLREISIQAKDPKFSEISLVFEAYETSIEHSALDPEDRLALAAKQANCGYLTGKVCFIDDFDGFTAPEHAMLRQLIACCDGVTVALCCDDLNETDDGLGLFSPVRRTANHLLRHAAKANQKVLAPIKLSASKSVHSPALHTLNNMLAFNTQPATTPPAGNIFFTEAADEWQEVRLAAAEMRRLGLAGVPFSRMALVCRDIAAYENVVRRELGMLDVPYFVDAPVTVEYTAPVSFVRAALALLRGGLASSPILALLKTGLCGYNETDIAALENYVFTWNPKAASWRAPFERNPNGLLANPSVTASKQLAKAEGVRSKIIPSIEKFIQNGRGITADKLCRQIYLLLDHFDAPKHAEENALQLEIASESTLAETLRRTWDVAMDLLDQMAALLNGEALSPAEFDDLFLLLVRSTNFGQAPQSMECAVFTSADRMRLASPDYCFVLGLNEGEFPMQIGYSGLFTHADRDLLVDAGVEMPGSFENRTLLEEMFLYRALTAPRLGLYLSRPALRTGSAKSPASALEPILSAFSPPALSPTLLQIGATPTAAFSLLAQNYRENTEETASLYAALQNNGTPSTQSALQLLSKVENAGIFQVNSTAAIEALVGQSITLSATRAERFYECRFAYFMERVLGIRPRRRAEFSPLESGTLVHYILEHALREGGKEFALCTDEKLHTLAAKYADVFIAENLPDVGLRAAQLLHEVKNTVAQLLCYMRDGAAQSEFSIDSLELPLSAEEGGVPPLKIQTPGGRTLQVTGKIDRVDTLIKDGKTYLSIMDYKTGGKKFSLANVYCGLNMQMMIYMHTLCKNGIDKYKNPVPAGVLYLTADPAPESGMRGSAQPLYEMDGILLDDPAILRAIDREGEGLFLPLKHKAGKPARAGQKLASLEKLGNIEQHVESLLAQMADEVYKGGFPAKPLVKGQARPCTWCAYRAACRHEDGRSECEIFAPKDVFEANIEGGLSNE